LLAILAIVIFCSRCAKDNVRRAVVFSPARQLHCLCLLWLYLFPSCFDDVERSGFLSGLGAACWQLAHSELVSSWCARQAMYLLSISTFRALVHIAGSQNSPPTIPEGSAAFHPPFDAIKFLQQAANYRRNLLNDSHYGAV
jgi:hypothetical protein